MDEEKPKLETWSMDSTDINQSPELQRQKPVSWSAVGTGMANDARQHFTTRWYFNAPMLIIVFFIGYISPLIALILAVFVMAKIIGSAARSPQGPHKTGYIIGWSILGIILIGLIIL